MVVDKDTEVLFQSLISAFGLSVRLGVVGGTDVLSDSQGTAEFSGECGCETGVSIRNDVCGKSVMWEYISSVKFGGVFGIDRFVTGDKNRCFQKGICDRKYGVVRFRKRKFDNKVHGYRSKWCVISV